MRKALILALLFAAVIAAADLPPGKWTTARPITLPTGFQRGMVYLPLDEQALTVHSTSEYRVVQGAAAEVPYRMILENGEVVSETVPSKVVNWTENNDATGAPRAVAIALDLGAESTGANAVEIDLIGDNFSAHVSVGGEFAASTIKTDTVYRRGAGFEKTSVEFPAASSRHLTLTLERDQGRLPKVNGVRVSRAISIAQRLVAVPAKLTRTEDRKERGTVLDLDPGKLVRDIADTWFEIGDPLFDRQVTVEVALAAPRPGEPVSYAGGAGAQLTRTNPSDRAVLPLRIDAARLIRMFIDNGDDRPLKITSVQLWREQRGLIFNAEPGAKYELWYGRKGAPEPVYDLAKLPLTLPPSQLPQVALAPARALPLAPPPPPPWSETHRALFWAILIAVVLLLLLVIVKAMRKANVAT